MPVTLMFLIILCKWMNCDTLMFSKITTRHQHEPLHIAKAEKCRWHTKEHIKYIKESFLRIFMRWHWKVFVARFKSFARECLNIYGNANLLGVLTWIAMTWWEKGYNKCSSIFSKVSCIVLNFVKLSWWIIWNIAT